MSLSFAHHIIDRKWTVDIKLEYTRTYIESGNIIPVFCEQFDKNPLSFIHRNGCDSVFFNWRNELGCEELQITFEKSKSKDSDKIKQY